MALTESSSGGLASAKERTDEENMQKKKITEEFTLPPPPLVIPPPPSIIPPPPLITPPAPSAPPQDICSSTHKSESLSLVMQPPLVPPPPPPPPPTKAQSPQNQKMKNEEDSRYVSVTAPTDVMDLEDMLTTLRSNRTESPPKMTFFESDDKEQQEMSELRTSPQTQRLSASSTRRSRKQRVSGVGPYEQLASMLPPSDLDVILKRIQKRSSKRYDMFLKEAAPSLLKNQDIVNQQIKAQKLEEDLTDGDECGDWRKLPDTLPDADLVENIQLLQRKVKFLYGFNHSLKRDNMLKQDKLRELQISVSDMQMEAENY